MNLGMLLGLLFGMTAAQTSDFNLLDLGEKMTSSQDIVS